MLDAATCDPTAGRSPEARVRGRRFRVVEAPAVREVLGAFTGAFEAGTLAFFDALLPNCERMLDAGAHVGLTALYAASHGVTVTAYEPNPDTLALLRENLALNPEIAARVLVEAAALGAADGTATLFAKAPADSGSSLFKVVERASVIGGAPAAEVAVRDARAVLEAFGQSRETLVKIDIEGAEYDVLPAIAPLLAERLPPLHVSFHPFNLVGRDGYETELLRAEAGLRVARALACYDHAYAFAGERCVHFGPGERLDVLHEYLLRRKPVPRIASPQYGFVEAWGFTAEPVAGLG